MERGRTCEESRERDESNIGMIRLKGNTGLYIVEYSPPPVGRDKIKGFGVGEESLKKRIKKFFKIF